MWAFWHAPEVPYIPNAPSHFRKALSDMLKPKTVYVENLDVVITNQRRQITTPDFVTAITWSPCGKYVLIAHHVMKVIIWKESTNESVYHFDFAMYNPRDCILYMSWHWSYGILAVSKYSKGFVIDNPVSSDPLVSIVTFNDYNVSVAQRCDDKLALATLDKRINVYQWPTRQLLWSCSTIHVVSHLHWLTPEVLFVSPWNIFTVALLRDGTLQHTMPIKGMVDTVHESTEGLFIASSSLLYGDRLYILTSNELRILKSLKSLDVE